MTYLASFRTDRMIHRRQNSDYNDFPFSLPVDFDENIKKVGYFTVFYEIL